MKRNEFDRRGFLGRSGAAAAAVALGGGMLEEQVSAAKEGANPKRIRVGVIGCGSVSNAYLPHLAKCHHAEVVSTCDIIPERAEKQARQFHIDHHYPHIDKMLDGVDFDLMVNLTDMQEHEGLNRRAIEAGKHVWSEKPMANSLPAGQKILEQARARRVRIWGAPVVVTSPQFAFMAETISDGKLGRLASAHAVYGHTGPDWSAFFYEKGGGSIPDLGVYSLTTLTGLLGPARSVTAMLSIVTPTRMIHNKGEIKVEAEDNAMIVLDHGEGVLSHVQCGFNFFNPHGHSGDQERRHSLTVFGTQGCMGLVGYDWESLGVDLSTDDKPEFGRHVEESAGYQWQQGASLVAECLATGKEPLFTPEHALHVVEIIGAARESQQTGRRIDLRSKFPWPVISVKKT
jgi:predicted dehydrogenase